MNPQALCFQHLTFGYWPAFFFANVSTQGLILLRIDRSANGKVLITLSGRMHKESIAELETIIRAEASGRPIVLDLKDMTLTGQDGIDFLARCEAADIALVNCDPYVREWITRQKTEASPGWLDQRNARNDPHS